ncbi:hypothetical protein TNCV_797221 [Trichonephila clavipes]|uniref:Uncharacterized protein n=1 Tax=Trichonephila clavipes TaxID=2585209 RepID=A0A8X7BLB8_TRICX|nr:hypothetical protein TNCV_797221 [Trichonephila clavipes]
MSVLCCSPQYASSQHGAQQGEAACRSSAMRKARHLPQRWYWSIVLQVRDVIRQFTQGTPNWNTNPKATVFGILKEPVLESSELITSRLTGAGSLPASCLRRSMKKGTQQEPKSPLSPVRVAAHGKHAGKTQNQF